ncbi:mRNA cleavage and polyadenylation factor clp1 [Penicillium argentinense]|uniref:Polynucleotide 5'-hydroxyl-kinase GRC3 n=1 Tax=Penicillium argentinense TaxID=1131581 RepID=A0A9W9FE17_9EURO|nr:mRNA cleavage and polyadenylation factor clp1 [Penicillium argentinense]KAJ5098359.1 mRNA cleavage and polyadenylation factor clp1 [Penicillium argentinense]
MSLPGLELAQPSEERQHSAAPPSQITLKPGSEWRFEVAFGHSIKVRLLTGTAELFGTELAELQTYTFCGTKAAIYTWHGCELEVSAGETNTATLDGVTPTAGHGAGGCQSEYVAEETPMVEYANAHFALETIRQEAHGSGKDGPRVLLLGPEDAGKTSLAKILTAYATKSGRQPIVVNLDPTEGMLSVPGTITATAFRTMLNIEEGWGSSPMSGPSPVPVKLPLVYGYPHPSPLDANGSVYRPLVSRLAVSVTGRMAEDEDSRETGIIVDTPGILSSGKPGTTELINHIVTEFAITTIIVLGSERLYSNMVKQYDNKPSASASADVFDERVSVLKLSKSGGCVDRDPSYLKTAREYQIKSYFFGTSIYSPSPFAVTLSPHTSQLDFAGLSVYNYTVTSEEDEDEDEYDPSQLGMDSFGEETKPTESDRPAPLPGIVGLSVNPPTSSADNTPFSNVPLKKVLPPAPTALTNTLLAITHAPTTATPAQVRDASVIGFLYVASVEPEKGKIHVLAPVGGRVPQRAMIWAKRWPDEVIGLVN